MPNARRREPGRHLRRGAHLSMKEAARQTPMSPGWLAVEVDQGAGPAYYEFGNRRFATASDMDKWIDARRVEAGGRGSGKCPTCKRPLP